MKKSLYHKIKSSARPLLAALVDPDKANLDYLEILADFVNKNYADLIFVGGSLTFKSVNETVKFLKSKTQKPIILYPGNPLQLNFDVDAILFLSLISGRNAQYLIGHHISVAPMLKQSGVEVIPTGYILVESGKITSVEYISDTKPIPKDKPQIAVATAIAGELLGLKMIYLEAGSGANEPVNFQMIRQVKSNIDIPLIVGGGIKNENDFRRTLRAGADIVVVGTVLEENIFMLPTFWEILEKRKF